MLTYELEDDEYTEDRGIYGAVVTIEFKPVLTKTKDVITHALGTDSVHDWYISDIDLDSVTCHVYGQDKDGGDHDLGESDAIDWFASEAEMVDILTAYARDVLSERPEWATEYLTDDAS